MGHTGIEKLTYGVKDRDTAVKFWSDFGLVPVDSHSSADVFEVKNGATVEIRDPDDPSIPPAVGDDPQATVREVMFGVATENDLEDLAANLKQDREVRQDADGSIHTTDPLGFGLAFRVARAVTVTPPDLQVNVPGRPQRINRRAPMAQQANPLEISHVVYVTNDIEAQKTFYVDRLGFKMTDSYPGRGYFLRCSDAHNHHNLFLLDPGANRRGFHHVAFELGSIHELFGGGNNMTRNGWETHLGPGRHPISSCYFWYFKNPCGGAAEYDFDSDVVDDDWEPCEWEPKPENFAEWCLAEGMGDTLRYTGIQGG